MALQRQILKTVSPAPSVTAGTPKRLSDDDIFVRTLIIESHRLNTGAVYVGFSNADLLNTDAHVLDGPGDFISISSSEYADLNAEINLRDIWFDGSVNGDELVISYIEITSELL